MSTTEVPQSTSAMPRVPISPAAAAASPKFDVELKQAFNRNESIKPLFTQLTALVREHAEADFVAFFRRDMNGGLLPFASAGKINQSAQNSTWKAFCAGCATALERLDVFVGALQQNPGQRIVAAPIYSPNGQPFVLGALLSDSQMQPAARIAMVDHVAGAASHWQLMTALSRLDWEAQSSAAAAELVAKIQGTDSLNAACFLVVDQLKSFFQCDQVAIGLVPPGKSGAMLTAISGMSDFDRSSEPIEALQNALDEAVVRGAVTAWPPLDTAERHATLAHRKLLEVSRADAVLSSALMDHNDNTVGALVFVGRRDIVHRPQRVNAVEAITPHLATALTTRREMEPSRIRKLWQSVAGDQGSHRRKLLLIGGLMALAMVPFCPWRYRVGVSCTLEPVTRRFSVAPYEGILKTSLVKPGDLVEQGQVLARMDDRELRWELQSAMADLERATKKRDVAMAEQDTSEKQMAALEMESLNLKIELLKHRERFLEVTSPIAGVVLAGDLDDAEGAPVKVGQGLFEVAPLEMVKLELAVLEEDLPSIEVGMQVKARMDGFRGAEVTGQIQKIHPRSEIRENKNVFVAEVELDNPENALRPGMSGKARVTSHIRPLGWIWFHKAWHKLKIWIG